jgi:hypothetical protein
VGFPRLRSSLNPDLLNLGGGLPAHYWTPVPTLSRVWKIPLQ